MQKELTFEKEGSSWYIVLPNWVGPKSALLMVGGAHKILDEISDQMGIHIMGTIGILMVAYEDDILTADEVKKCIDGLQNAGRHIGHKHYQMLLDRLK